MEPPPARNALETPEFFAQLAACDKQAVGRLFRHFAGTLMDHLLRTKRRHCLPESEWADVVQDVFVRFLDQPPVLDPARPIEPFLRKMAYNRAIDRAKKIARRAANETRIKQERARAAVGSEVADAPAIAAETKAQVESKWAKLSESDQQALAQFVHHGPNRHVAALAATAGIMPGAAQMRFSRAKARWTNIVDEDDQKKPA